MGTAVVLASASPRRRDLLSAAGLTFEVDPSNFDEAEVRHLPPRRLALVAARGKALDVHRRRPGRWIIGCDTIVVVDGRSLGKPASEHHAALMLKSLSGRRHSVVSAVCVVAPDGRRLSGMATSTVGMQVLPPAVIRAYVAGGEPLDKAGAYAIQGQAGEFTRLIRGRRDTVIGLPLNVVLKLLRDLGYPAAGSLSDRLDLS